MRFSTAILSLAFAGVASAQVSVLQTVFASPDHETLEAAVDAAHAEIGDTLDNPDVTFTLFAPDDNAFATLPEGTVGRLTSEPWLAHLSCVLLGHVYAGGAVPSSDITAPTTVDSAFPGYELNLAPEGMTVTVNGIPVSVPDINATNGIIHSLSEGVLLPPCVTDNIPEAATTAGRFTKLLELVTTAGLGDALSGPPTPEGLTVMAPNDDAFASVSADVLAYLGENVTALTEVLSYHVIASNVIPTEDAQVTTLQGEDIEVTVDGESVTLNDESMVLGAILASNGIIREIDAVLLPPDFSLPEGPTDAPATPIPTDAPATPIPSPTVSVLQTVIDSPDHMTLEAAVIAAPAEIGDTLDDPAATLTLFAPDDSAFATLPDGTVELLTSEPWLDHLSCVLLGHVYAGGAVPSSDITAPTTVDSAFPGYELNLAPEGMTVTVNEIPVSVPDIEASNGIIHSLSNGVLLPPCVTDNIPEAATAAGGFTKLLELVTAADLGDALSGPPTPEGLTVMAPNDDAFANVPPAALAYLGGNVTALAEVLTYHVIASNVIPTVDTQVTTLQGEDIEVNVDGESITLNGDSTVVGTILASNGIIHEIDAVLLPPNFSFPDGPTDAPGTPIPTDAPGTPTPSPGATPGPSPTQDPAEGTPTPSPETTVMPTTSGAAKTGVFAVTVMGVAVLFI